MAQVTRLSRPSPPAARWASRETSKVRMLRTEAEDIGDGEPLIYFALERCEGQTCWPKREARRLSPRCCGGRATAFLRLAFVFGLFGFDTVFAPGDAFGLIHVVFPFF